jgi:hypothetical protein
VDGKKEELVRERVASYLMSPSAWRMTKAVVALVAGK